MKTFILLFSILIIHNSAFAQDPVFKPNTGDIVTEVNFTPFSDTPISLNEIKIRHYSNNNIVQRIAVRIASDVVRPEKDITLSTFEIGLYPGIEHHLEGTSKLSPYYGGEIAFFAKISSSEDETNGQQIRTIDGAWSDSGDEIGYLAIGANAFAGLDYYIAERLYLGFEFGFGFAFQQFSSIKTKIDGDRFGEKIDGPSVFSISPLYNGSIRLGFAF